MTRGTGIAIPCATCAAALPVDLRSQRLRCRYCHARNVIPKVQIVAAAKHLERVAAMARAADEAAGEGDYQRRRRRFRPGAILAFFAPLLVSWWIVLGLGVAVSAMFGVFALAPGIEHNQIVGPLVALGAMLIWAGWVAVLRLFLTRRRAVTTALPAPAPPVQLASATAVTV